LVENLGGLVEIMEVEVELADINSEVDFMFEYLSFYLRSEL
jgi:hypothetical protein